jgi:hypothetical protein
MRERGGNYNSRFALQECFDEAQREVRLLGLGFLGL